MLEMQLKPSENGKQKCGWIHRSKGWKSSFIELQNCEQFLQGHIFEHII